MRYWSHARQPSPLGCIGERASELVATTGIGISLAYLGASVVALLIARALLDVSLADANVLLVVAPIVSVMFALVGTHWVHPLNQLAAWRSCVDVAWFAGACAALL